MEEKPPEDPKVKELTDQMAKLQKELDDAKAALKTHEDAKVQAQKEKFDADWLALEKSVIPPGEVKDPADKAKLQKMSVEDPLGFAAKIAGWKKAPAMGAEGTSHAQGPGGEDKEAERNRILAQKQAIPGTLH
jgi:alanyl-tRNA synthetase